MWAILVSKIIKIRQLFLSLEPIIWVDVFFWNTVQLLYRVEQNTTLLVHCESLQPPLQCCGTDWLRFYVPRDTKYITSETSSLLSTVYSIILIFCQQFFVFTYCEFLSSGICNAVYYAVKYTSSLKLLVRYLICKCFKTGSGRVTGSYDFQSRGLI